MRNLGKLRFFFDWNAGGCLWAGDDQTRDALGYGPVDADSFNLEGKISTPSSLKLPREIKALIAEMDIEHYTALNPDYPPDPSLWRQRQCDSFNAKIEHLLSILTEELGSNYEILDQQHRYSEDPNLDDYLKDPTGYKR